ncbi:MAG: response regulator transcription factor [Caldilineaceae bacterium]
MAAQELIRVFIVDRVRAIAEMLAATLAAEADIAVLGFATTADETRAQQALAACQLILISTNLPESGALLLTEWAKQRYPDLKVVVLGLVDNEAVLMRYIEAGVSGYTLITDSIEEVRTKVRAPFAQEAFVAPEVAAALMDRIANLSDMLTDVGINPDSYEELTEREREILELVATGLTNQEIGERLIIENGTVKNHIHNIFEKLNVSTRRDAAIFLSLLQEHEMQESVADEL